MTPEEFDAVTDYDDRFVYELIHGVLIVSPLPGESERDPNEELGFLLRIYQYQHPQGTALDKTLTEQYIALPDSRRRADRVIWVGLGRVPNPQKRRPVNRRRVRVQAEARPRSRLRRKTTRVPRRSASRNTGSSTGFERTMTVFKFAPGEPTDGRRQGGGTRIAPRSCPASSSRWPSCSKSPTTGPAEKSRPKDTDQPKTHAQ